MAVKYDNCKDCHSRCVHAGKDREFICINGVSCKISKEKPNTNADRIRSMSDEELAKLLDYELGCPVTGDCAKMSKDCKACWLDWLQQPAEGE